MRFASTLATVLALDAVTGCSSEAPLERLPEPQQQLQPLDPRLIPPRPPPPPPPPPGPRPPPAEIARVLRGCELPAISFHEVTQADGGLRFLGYRERSRHPLPAAAARELATLFLEDTSYYDDGDVGCGGLPMGIRIACGSRVVDIVEDCSRCYLTEQGYNGPWLLFSSSMSDRIVSFRAAASAPVKGEP